ncbi:MAG: AbrB/MazE/SpoVT family DNA-binding domain-containing protein [Nocardioides sp.]
MSGTYVVSVGDRGRIVVPAELRQERGWPSGTLLHLIPDVVGVRIMTQEELLAVVRADFSGHDLVSELIAERRAEAARDLAEHQPADPDRLRA